MVNPGRNNFLVSYNKNKDFWEKELPQMNHKIGNHTWNHKGAENLEEADFEIGSASKLIWKLFPNDSKLNVFASGGRELWGGKRWSKADSSFKEIPKLYNLIDLYSGNHAYVELNSDFDQNKIKEIISDIISEKKHQQLVFHKIGKKSIFDYVRLLLKNYNYTFGKRQFLNLIEFLNSNKNKIWIAPIIDIIKYETQRKSSKIEFIKRSDKSIILDFKVNTDSNLYNHELTMIIPSFNKLKPNEVIQDKKSLKIIKSRNNTEMVNIKPINSRIFINYS